MTSTYSTAWHTVVIQLLSRVQFFVTPWTVACQAPLSMEFLQARILEWVAISYSRGCSRPRDQTRVSSTAGSFFTGSLSHQGSQNSVSRSVECKKNSK